METETETEPTKLVEDEKSQAQLVGNDSNSVEQQVIEDTSEKTLNVVGYDARNEEKTKCEETVDVEFNDVEEKILTETDTKMDGVEHDDNGDGDGDGPVRSRDNGLCGPKDDDHDIDNGEELKDLPKERDANTQLALMIPELGDKNPNLCFDNSGSDNEEEQATFLKEVEAFYKEKHNEFKHHKFYNEDLNLLKLWRAVIKLGGYEQALLEYEKHKIHGGELPHSDAPFIEPNGVETQVNVLSVFSGMQLSFSNKASMVPRFLSFNGAQEHRSRKAAHDPPLSSGFMAIPTADSYGLNQTITVSMSTPLLQQQFASPGQNITGHAVNPQPFVGVPIMASPVSVVPPSSSVIGTTNIRNTIKSSGAPSQLTIFYNGSVCVYNDVSPEKAQAIMLLAGNGSSASQSKTPPMTQTQTHNISRPCTAGAFSGTMSPFSGVPSHTSVTSHVSLQSSGGSSRTNELTTATRLGALASSSNQPEPLKLINSVGSYATTLPAAVPQARKASLARFLEKRKERVSNTSPYNICKKSPDSSYGTSFSVTSA